MNRKGLITIGTVLFMMLASPFVGTAVVGVQTSDQIHETVETVPEADTALVLGAAAYGNRLSDVLRDRVDTAIELYEAEKVGILLMSGAPNEVEAMKNYAIEQKVAENDIKMDPNGLNTMASVKNMAKMEGSSTIVTQHYHLPRALFIANTLGIEASGLKADKSEYLKIFDFKTREILATSKAIYDLFFVE